MKTPPTAISERHARQLIETYGGSPAYWPQDKRASLEAAIDEYPGLAATLSRENALDQKIMARLTPASPQFIDQITAQFSHPFSSQIAGSSGSESNNSASVRTLGTLGGAWAAAALAVGIIMGPYVTDALVARSLATSPLTLSALNASAGEDILAVTSFELWTLSD